MTDNNTRTANETADTDKGENILCISTQHPRLVLRNWRR